MEKKSKHTVHWHVPLYMPDSVTMRWVLYGYKCVGCGDIILKRGG